jgi:hypothetical protein
MGRDHAAFGISLAASATDAHKTKRKQTMARFFKNPPV